MTNIMELLYGYWISEPEPERWPEYLQGNPVVGHGKYAFQEGFRLGMLLAVETLFPETRP